MVRKKKQTAKKQPIKKKRSPKKQIPKEELQEKKLTLKQQKFLKYYLQTGNASQSALKAGYKHRERGLELVSKSIVQEAYQQLLDEVGLTDKKDLEDLKKLREAKSTKFFQHEGCITETEEVEDNGTRLKALELTTKLKGRLITKTEHSGEIGGEATKIIIIRAAEEKGKHGTKNKT